MNIDPNATNDAFSKDREVDGFLDLNDAVSSPVRSRSSLRLKYEAEAKVIRQQHGDLEQIRKTLGLSQRRISQLLMMDPSAWNRWTKKSGTKKSGAEAPPHVYKMLELYMIAHEKYPSLLRSYYEPRSAGIAKEAASQIQEQVTKSTQKHFADISRSSFNELHQTISQLRRDLENTRHRLKWIAGVGCAALLLVIFMSLRIYFYH